ncbi:acylphosphatase [soil metagenome]
MKVERRGLRISGTVQGVGFRWWTKSQADRLGLKGWVRNESDGTVAVVLRGEPEQVEEMVDRLRQGPRGARVGSVEAADFEDAPEAADFRIRR